MKHKQQRRSYCPINFALESFGDPWSLLIIRDIVYFGKKTYGEFLSSEEGIATNILASRLAQMEKQGIITKRQSKMERRKEEYVLTEKGLDIIPLLVEIASWSAGYDRETAAPIDWITLCNTRKAEMIQLIRETVRDGGAVFVGPGSVLSKLAGEDHQL
jgi:DNA-binding HxlR family transcriptional regulator